MKPSSQSPRTPSRLSDSVHRQLNMYVLAASAAGVGVLALARPAQAKIIYTKTYHVIEGGAYYLHLNHKGADFAIYEQGNPFSGSNFLRAEGIGDNAVQGYFSVNESWASALNKSSLVGSKRTFVGNERGAVMASFRCDTNCGYLGGPWAWNPNGYLGLKFKIGKQIHYGWAHLTVHEPGDYIFKATLTGYAYETIPNKPIIAGKTKGPDVITLEPGSLGRLAAGASAISAWRSAGGNR